MAEREIFTGNFNESGNAETRFAYTPSEELGGTTHSFEGRREDLQILSPEIAEASAYAESYVTGDTVITCVNGECTKTAVDPADKEAAAFAQNASQYKDSATNAGTEACPAGTCQVWKATGEAGDVTYYIDSENRISKIVLAQTGSETTFDYKDVTITVPTV